MWKELVDVLSEPAAWLESNSLFTNAVWGRRGLPGTVEQVRAQMLHGEPPAVSRGPSIWGTLEVARAGNGWLLRILSPDPAESDPPASEYQAIFEITNDALFLLNSSFEIVDLNPAACALHGWTREQLLQMNPMELVAPISHPAFREFMASMQQGKPFNSVAVEKRSDGTTFDVEIYGIFLHIRGQRHYMVSIRDISHFKAARRAVESSEARVRRALDASGSAYWELDLVNGESFSSKRCADLYGRSFSSIDTWLALGHPEDRTGLALSWAAHARGDAPRVQGTRRVQVGESWRWISESAFIFQRTSDGAPSRVAGSATDITHRKQLEERLVQGMRLESLGRMAGGVAHDFNNLLTVILAGGELALAGIPPHDQAAADIEEVLEAAKRARRMTDQLLTFSRKQVLQPRVLSLAVQVQTLRPVLKQVTGSRVHLEVDFADDLWDIHLDPGQLEQVIINLAGNAAAAMPDGGRLSFEADNVVLDGSYANTHPGATVGSFVRFTVSDTGIGMTPEVRARVFEPFFSAKSGSRGTGLGLATVYGVVQQNHGHVWVYSEPGKGTVFKLYFPRAGDVEDSPIPEPTLDLKDLGGDECILVVEDDDSVRRVAVNALKRAGYNTVPAASATDAITHYTKQPHVHMVITDVILGEGANGRQLADELRKLRPDLPVLFVSGYTENGIVKDGILKPGVDFLAKPYSPDELLRAVRRILEREAKPTDSEE